MHPIHKSTTLIVFFSLAVLVGLLSANPTRQAILGLAQGKIPLLDNQGKLNADTVGGKSLAELLQKADPVDARTLAGHPGLYYLDAGNLTGTISTDRYSAYDDLTAENKIPTGSTIITDKSSSLQQVQTDLKTNQTDTTAVKQQLFDLSLRSAGTITEVSTGLGLSGNVTGGKVAISVVPGVGITLTNGKVEATLGDSIDLTSEVLNILPIANGGTGLSAAPGAGQILVGNGSGYDLVNLAAGDGLAMTNSGGNLSFAVDTTVCRTTGNCAGSGGGIVGSGTQNYVPKFTGTGMLGNSLITDDGTTVGINNSLPNSSYALDVSGNINGSSYSIGGTSTLYTSGGNPVLHAAVGKYIAFAPNDSEAMRIDTAGNVGIGTTTPQSKLDVNGGVTIGSYSGVSAAPSGGLIVSGNVGIGTRTPASKLVVTAPGFSGQSNWTAVIDAPTSDTTTAALHLRNAAAGTIAYFRGDGNVGIGTNSPTSKLDVVGGVAIGSYAGVNAAPSNGLIVSGSVGIGTNSAAATLQIKGSNVDTSPVLSIANSVSSNVLYVQNNGLIGFGLTNPSSKLSLPASTTASGGIAFGSDTNLYRVGVGALKTDSAFYAQNGLTVGSLTTNGGILYASSTGAVSQLGAGSTGQCLQANTGAAASWGSCDAANTMTGTGTSGQVGFWNGTNTQTGDTQFLWDNVNKRLGIGAVGSPAATLDVASPNTSSNGSQIKANALTTGKGLYISSTSTAMTTGGLEGLDWSPTAATTMTGDLFSINVGPNGTVGNILNLTNDGLSVFSVSQSQITANVPVAFNAPGDFSIANDLQFTNSSASNIKSYGPLRIQAGDNFNSSDLTLGTYNSGVVMLDSLTVATADSTNVGIGMYSPSAALNIRSGVSTAGGAPIKLTAGTNLTTPEKGAIEYDGTYIYITDGTSSRQKISTESNTLTLSNKTIASSGLSWAGGAAPSLSSAGNAKQYFDSTSNTMKISENGGAFADTLNAGRALEQPIATKTAAYTITATDGIVLLNTSGGTFAVTLPSAVGIAGKQYTLKEISGSNFGTVNTTSSQTIDGSTTYTYSAQNETITVASDGANWQIIGKK